MLSEYNKIQKFDFSKWVVTKFYHYTSRATEVFARYDPIWGGKPRGDKYIKVVYEHFLMCANAYLNYPEITFASLGNQNKTTIEIFNIETGQKLYLTQYDGVYSIGTKVYTEFGNKTDIGIIRDKILTARDRGHIDEIIQAVKKVQMDYAISMNDEIKFLEEIRDK